MDFRISDRAPTFNRHRHIDPLLKHLICLPLAIELWLLLHVFKKKAFSVFPGEVLTKKYYMSLGGFFPE